LTGFDTVSFIKGRRNGGFGLIAPYFKQKEKIKAMNKKDIITDIAFVVWVLLMFLFIFHKTR